MKHIKVMSKPCEILAGVLLISLFTLIAAVLIGTPIYLRSVEMFLVAVVAVFVMGVVLFPVINTFRRIPLELAYDDEKIIGKFAFGKTVTVWKNQDIYYGVQSGKMGTFIVFSNTPFRAGAAYPIPRPSDRRITQANTYIKLNRKTQLVLTPKVFHQVYIIERCIPIDRVDWDQLVQLNAPKTTSRKKDGKITLWNGFNLTIFVIIHNCVLFSVFMGFPMYMSLKDFVFNPNSIYYIVLYYFPGLVIIVIFLGVHIYHLYKILKRVVTVSLEDYQIRSHKAKNVRCIVDLNQPVYYALFQAKEDFGTTAYIVISNNWFNYYTVNKVGKSYLDVYDQSTQIAFPYDDDTAAYCDFDSWHRVGGSANLNPHTRKAEK